MRFRFRTVAAVAALFVVAGWLAPVGSMAAPVGKPTVHVLDTKDGQMLLRVYPTLKPGTAKLTASQVRKMVAASPLDCSDDGTCIECDLFGWAPIAQDTIVTFEGAVYCFYPDMDYLPAPVTEIDLELGLSMGDSPLSAMQLKDTLYMRQGVDHLDITDAARCAGAGDYFVTVTGLVFFPECCPFSDSASGATPPYYVGCRSF